MHLFTYSPRPKTTAAKMKGQINGTVASKRSEQLRMLGNEMAQAYHQQFLGKQVDVLVERTKEGIAQGYSEHYIPVQFPSDEDLRGKIVSIRVEKVSTIGISGINIL